MTDLDQPHTVATQIPPSARDDMPFIRSLLAELAGAEGRFLDGEPTITEIEPASFEVDGQTVYPFGESVPMLRAECATKPVPETSPALVPSSETVEAVAACLQGRYNRTPWEDLPAHIKNGWAQAALAVIVRTGDMLIADSLAHVAANADAYGITDATALKAAADAVRKQSRHQG